MSKLLGLKDFLTEDEAINYFNYLTDEKLTVNDFNILRHDYLTLYKSNWYCLVPIKIGENGYIKNVDFDNSLLIKGSYIPVIYTAFFHKDIQDQYFDNCFLVDTDNNIYIYHRIGVEGLQSIVLGSNLPELDVYIDKGWDFFKTKDIEIFCSQYIKKDIKPKPLTSNKYEIMAEDKAGNTKIIYLVNQNYKNQDDQSESTNIERDLSARERNTLYKVIASLLIDCNMRESKNYKMADALIKTASLNGINDYPGDDTVANIIKAAKEYLPNNDPN